ncbi:MAG: M20 family metallo-hydrolase [Thermoplasmata archaeon]
MNARQLISAVAKDERLMVESLCSMLKVRAVGPESGGEGEYARGQHLLSLLRRLGFKDVEVLYSKDSRVPAGKRPNIVVRMRGRKERNMWVVTHMDTVPEGDIRAWKYPPFSGKVVKGRIYGRGSEDNGQELIASLYGLYALKKSKVVPECNVGLVFVSDEEHGNTHGIEFLLAKGLFKKGDLVVVPDHGTPDGSALCIVEKGIAWIDVEVVGRQTHASTPERGVNAFEVAARFIIAAVDRLRERFADEDPLFEPPVSTFSPTRCETNGLNVNTIPGRQRFSFDFRVLPTHRIDDVMAVLRSTADEVCGSSGAKIQIKFSQRADAAPKTPEDAEVVRRLKAVIKLARGKEPKTVGIGGGTCAAPFRRHGIEAVVWSTISGTAHDANEFARVKDLVADAQVYALLFAGDSIEVS